MSTKNRTRRTTTRNIRFPNQMIEQINIALEQKGSGNFSAWGHWSLPNQRCVRKRGHIHQLSDEEWTSRVLPSEQDDIVNSLNYRALQNNWVAVSLSWQWQTACWLCHRLNGFEWLAVMVISQPPGNNPSYYYGSASPTPPIYTDTSETPYVLYMQLQHHDAHRNGAIKHYFLHRIRSTEG